MRRHECHDKMACAASTKISRRWCRKQTAMKPACNQNRDCDLEILEASSTISQECVGGSWNESSKPISSQEWMTSRPEEPQDDERVFLPQEKRGSFDWGGMCHKSAKTPNNESRSTWVQYGTMLITGVTTIVWSQLWEHLDHRSVLEEPVKVL
jgi:hypothetical protein